MIKYGLLKNAGENAIILHIACGCLLWLANHRRVCEHHAIMVHCFVKVMLLACHLQSFLATKVELKHC